MAAPSAPAACPVLRQATRRPRIMLMGHCVEGLFGFNSAPFPPFHCCSSSLCPAAQPFKS